MAQIEYKAPRETKLKMYALLETSTQRNVAKNVDFAWKVPFKL